MATTLVLIDFSETSIQALRAAIQVAQELQHRVIAFHSILPIQGVDNNIYSAFNYEDFVTSKKLELTNLILEQKQALGTDVEVLPMVEIGFLLENVKAIRDREGLDLIIMGATNTEQLERFLLKTNAINFVKQLSTPLLIIHHTTTLFKDDFTCVLASDLSIKKLHNKSYHLLKSLMSKSQTRPLHVAHVAQTPVSTEQEAEFSKLLCDIPHEYNYIHGDSIDGALLEFTNKLNASLLTVIAHHHTWLERLFKKSNTEWLSYHTELPLLVLHEHAE